MKVGKETIQNLLRILLPQETAFSYELSTTLFGVRRLESRGSLIE
jgi:hypothetical protein